MQGQEVVGVFYRAVHPVRDADMVSTTPPDDIKKVLSSDG
jgi:hypothetical protein